MPAYCVIRNDRDVFVPERRLTLEEREQIEERKHSPEARRRFGVELRRVRQPEHKAYKAVMKLLEAKPNFPLLTLPKTASSSASDSSC